jgi:hypothetical protein
MKKDETNSRESELIELKDELRPEYDLSQLQVRRLGPGRQQFGDTVVRLAPDVAAVFQNADAVNDALRLLIKVAQSSHQLQQAA